MDIGCRSPNAVAKENWDIAEVTHNNVIRLGHNKNMNVRTPIIDKNGKLTHVWRKELLQSSKERDSVISGVPSQYKWNDVPTNYPSDYIRIPQNMTLEEVRIASDYIDERLDGDDSYSRAHWAEVSNEGIAYGVDIMLTAFREDLAGEQRKDETDDEYEERVNEQIENYRYEIGEALAQKYGGEFEEGSEEQISISFYVEYEGRPNSETIEYMGDRVESETKLLDLVNDYDYGGSIGQLIRSVIPDPEDD